MRAPCAHEPSAWRCLVNHPHGKSCSACRKCGEFYDPTLFSNEPGRYFRQHQPDPDHPRFDGPNGVSQHRCKNCERWFTDYEQATEHCPPDPRWAATPTAPQPAKLYATRGEFTAEFAKLQQSIQKLHGAYYGFESRVTRSHEDIDARLRAIQAGLNSLINRTPDPRTQWFEAPPIAAAIGAGLVFLGIWIGHNL